MKNSGDNTWSIYKITNKVNDMAYIGITKGHFTSRWKTHAKRCHNSLLKDHFDSYGFESFIWEVLKTDITEKRAKRLERDFIHSTIDEGIEVYNVQHKQTFQPTPYQPKPKSKLKPLPMPIKVEEPKPVMFRKYGRRWKIDRVTGKRKPLVKWIYTLTGEVTWLPETAECVEWLRLDNEVEDICIQVDRKHMYVDQSYDEYIENHIENNICVWIMDSRGFKVLRLATLEWLYDNPTYISW